MKNNPIKNAREAEIKAKKAAEEAAAKEARLKDIKPLNIVETLAQLEEEKTDAKVVCDKEGNPVAVCGGKYLCEVYKGEVIGAETQEKLDAIKARVDKGIRGDGLLHKMVTINGKTIPCVGATEEEIDEDVKSIEKYSAEHPTEPRRDLTVAEMLKDAGYKSADIEQIKVNGKDYILVYHGPDAKNYAMDLNGNTVANLDNIKDKLGRESVKILLTERLEKVIVKPEPKKVEPKPAPRSTTPKAASKCVYGSPCCQCYIVLENDVTEMPLDEVIKRVLRAQTWSKRPYGTNPECPWLNSVFEGMRLLPRSDEDKLIKPVTVFILENIDKHIPIEAEDLQDLHNKLTSIVYEALGDEPYFGMEPSIGRSLAKVIATNIIKYSTVHYK